MRSRAPQKHDRGGGRIHPLLAVVLVVLAACCGLFYYQSVRVRSLNRGGRLLHATGTDLVAQRQMLVEEIEKFNKLPGVGGQGVALITVATPSPPLSCPSCPTVSCPTCPSCPNTSCPTCAACPDCPKATCPDCPKCASAAAATSTAVALPWQCAENKVFPEEYKMRPAEVVEKEYPELVEKLKKHANPQKEILLTLANGVMICKNTTICWWNGGNILESFLTILERNNITNHLIGVMDDETETYLKDRKGVNWFRVKIKIPESQKNSHPANQVSTIKYTLIQALLEMGYHTLISDMDLVYIDDPFKHLHRDSDVEIQTDGFDDMAYGTTGGVHDPSMGWGGGGLYMQLFTTNVGCMYARATQRTYTLMKQVANHLRDKAGWDQQVFNEYLLHPSHGRDFNHSGATLRVLDYMKFVNSKIFFKSRRDEFIPGKSATAAKPVMVHFNYHPDKHKRMLCIMDRYFYDKVDACDSFPAGSPA